MASHTLGNGVLSVAVDSLGAELRSLVDGAGHQLLWQAGPQWPRHAPVLFPIVGRMPEDTLLHDGVAYPIGQHGFARDQEFAVSEQTESSVLFTLRSNESTLPHFPFPFRLEIRYALAGERLGVTTTVTNTGNEAFSASLGEHPGFAWPLIAGVAREAHNLEFAVDEPAPIRRIAEGLLRPDPQPTPVVGRTLPLSESLFADDAVIFDRLSSRSVRYSAPGTPTITVDFEDFPLLGVWSKAPGEFVCIEPWFGMTAPAGFAGEYETKPGQFRLEAGQSRSFAHGIVVSEP